MPGKNSSKQSRRDSGGALLDLPKLVSKLLRLLVAPPLIITHREIPLTLPGCRKLPPLRKKLNLLACHSCGDSTRTETFLRKQPNVVLQSWRQSSQKLHDAHIRKRLLFVLKGKHILFAQL